MSKNRNKDTEIFDARIKLDDVLHTLIVPKADQTIDNDKEQNNEIDIEYPNSPILNPFLNKSPKGSGRYARKRKNREELSDHESQSSQLSTGSLKIFDRTVDFLQFDGDVSLYCLCRAWVRNQSTLSYERANTFLESNNGNLVYELPPPIKLEEGQAYPFIPSPLPTQNLNTDDINSRIDYGKDLLTDHIQRWRNIREKWRKASELNESRYAQSYNILADMFDKQFQESTIS